MFLIELSADALNFLKTLVTEQDEIPTKHALSWVQIKQALENPVIAEKFVTQLKTDAIKEAQGMPEPPRLGKPDKA